MVIFWVFAGLTAFGLISYGLQILAVRSYLRETENWRREDTVSPCHCIPVSILKPLKGLDDNLFDNLESFCVQDYPQYEIIFSLQDHNDPAYKVARKIKEKYPDKKFPLLSNSAMLASIQRLITLSLHIIWQNTNLYSSVTVMSWFEEITSGRL